MPLPGPGSGGFTFIGGGIPTTGGDGGFGPTEDLCAEYEDFDVGIIRIGPGGVVGGGGGYGDDTPAPEAAPGETEPGYTTFDDYPNDPINETTEIAVTDTYMLTGQNISTQLSTRTPGCIDTDQIERWPTTRTHGTKGFIDSEYGWEDPGSIPAWADDFQYSVSDAVAILKYNMSSQYIDPEIGTQGVYTGIAMYAHASPDNNMPDPVLNTDPESGPDADTGYGSKVYEDPFAYSERERSALEAKFGFFDPSYTPDLYEGTLERLEDAMKSLVDSMQTGTTARANVTRTTPPLVVSDAVYEEITTNEIEEVAGIGTSVGTTRQISTTTGGDSY